MNLTLKRLSEYPEADAVFGELYIEDILQCTTLERLSTLMLPGTYTVTLDVSPHLGYLTPHIHVPDRDAKAGGDAGLRIHIANYPHQLEGCVAVGTVHNQDSISNSRFAFSQLMAKLSEPIILTISSI